MSIADKPDLNEDLLIHFGVKGMKWGRRKARDDGGSGSGGSAPKVKKKKLTSNDIREARAQHQARVAELYRADQQLRTATTQKGKDIALRQVDKMAQQIAKSDDARIANKMTRGEKVAALVIAGPIGAVVIGANKFATRERKTK